MLRSLVPDRRVERSAIDAVFTYQTADTTGAALDELHRAGLISSSAWDVALTAKGVSAIDRLLDVMAEFIEATWRTVDIDFDGLYAITTRAAGSVEVSGGAFGVARPVYEPPGTPIRTRFAESLTPLRFYRFDAHIAAWRNAFLPVEQVQVLADGPVKEAVEAETNRRSAVLYATLSDDERATLLAGLRSLPTP